MGEVKSVRDADVKGKRVLLRADFNVLDEEGALIDGRRIQAVVPTIKFLLDAGATKVTIMTHVGRPGGKTVENLRVAPIAALLKDLIDDSRIELLENLRFDPREESNDEGYAKELALLGDLFVNDAFAVSHRVSASIVSIPKLLPSYAGLLMEKEIQKLTDALHPPAGSIALMCGAKGETKIPLIEKLADIYAKVLVGGAIANEYKPTKPNEILPTDGVPQLQGMLDVGPLTAAAWEEEVRNAPFVLWNGPLGFYEKGYTASTDGVAEAIVSGSARAVIGGGNTIAALSKFSFDPERVYLSTGGGAMLQFLVDGTLPGIEALRQAQDRP